MRHLFQQQFFQYESENIKKIGLGLLLGSQKNVGLGLMYAIVARSLCYYQFHLNVHFISCHNVPERPTA